MTRPLTKKQQEVAELVGCGLRYKVIAIRLGISEDGVAQHVCAIAAKVGNPDNLDPRDVVFLWMRQQMWEHERTKPAA